MSELFLRCHVCDDTFRGTNEDAYREGWRVWSLKLNRMLCPKHAEQNAAKHARKMARLRSQP